MALTDVNFQEGEIQDFLLEVPTATYTGSVTDFLVESGGSQFMLLETPEIDNVFIMSE
ncbi:MAG: hypothetical protein AAB534_03470 [Patescibacteria group bacterium]